MRVKKGLVTATDGVFQDGYYEISHLTCDIRRRSPCSLFLHLGGLLTLVEVDVDKQRREKPSVYWVWGLNNQVASGTMDGDEEI